MVGMRRTNIVKAGIAALALAGSVGLSGCAESTSDSAAAGGEGIAAGASMEEYKAAFADVDPITINTQSPAPKGSATGRNVEDYVKAVTEWSDGKITFEIAFSNAVAPPAEIDDALVDGRLDLGQVLPIYEPSEYPANTALIDASFVSDQSSIVGGLQSNAWPNEVAFNTPEILKEYEDHGMVPLVPSYNSGPSALFCGSEISDLAKLKGAAIGTPGATQSKQLKALGASPASVGYSEVFESLQRGVIDCTNSAPTVGVLSGFIPAAPHVVIDPEAGFAVGSGSMAFSKKKWDGLPLIAQQLLWDKIGVFVQSNLTQKIWPNNAEAAKLVKKNGGAIVPFAADARKALQDENAALLDGLRGTDVVADGDSFVDAVVESAAKWKDEVKALGYEDEASYQDFDTWYSEGKVDLQPYLDKVTADVFGAHRPS